jgi:hypothetical protein
MTARNNEHFDFDAPISSGVSADRARNTEHFNLQSAFSRPALVKQEQG